MGVEENVCCYAGSWQEVGSCLTLPGWKGWPLHFQECEGRKFQYHITSHDYLFVIHGSILAKVGCPSLPQ